MGKKIHGHDEGGGVRVLLGHLPEHTVGYWFLRARWPACRTTGDVDLRARTTHRRCRLLYRLEKVATGICNEAFLLGNFQLKDRRS
jgi:hypothetical protein